MFLLKIQRGLCQPKSLGTFEKRASGTKSWCSRDILCNDSWMVFIEGLELIFAKLASLNNSVLKKCRHFTSLASSALTHHLRSDFSALFSFDARSQFQPFFVFQKLSLESDSSLLFSFSNILTTFRRLNYTVHF